MRGRQRGPELARLPEPPSWALGAVEASLREAASSVVRSLSEGPWGIPLMSHCAGGREVQLDPRSSSAEPPRAPGQRRGAAVTWPPDHRAESKARGPGTQGNSWSALSFLKWKPKQ